MKHHVLMAQVKLAEGFLAPLLSCNHVIHHSMSKQSCNTLWRPTLFYSHSDLTEHFRLRLLSTRKFDNLPAFHLEFEASSCLIYRWRVRSLEAEYTGTFTLNLVALQSPWILQSKGAKAYIWDHCLVCDSRTTLRVDVRTKALYLLRATLKGEGSAPWRMFGEDAVVDESLDSEAEITQVGVTAYSSTPP